jgi:hypothetical protein
MTAKLVVYSCITSSYDQIHNTLLRGDAAQDEDGVRYIVFSDVHFPCKMRTDGMEWEVEELKWEHSLCPRRTARYHKCLPHVVLPPHEKSLWVDGSLAFKAIHPLSDIVESCLNDEVSIATMTHPIRKCVYQEEKACVKLRKDQNALMRQQMEKYVQDGYPTYNGMVETACLARKNNSTATGFNQAWWGEIENHSFRDQLSFNYVCWKLGLSYGNIEGERFNSPFFNHINHPRS